jgi:hypothetical protein
MTARIGILPDIADRMAARAGRGGRALDDAEHRVTQALWLIALGAVGYGIIIKCWP